MQNCLVVSLIVVIAIYNELKPDNDDVVALVE